MTKTALITGITGHDGAYLAEFLLKKGYIVHGIKRRASLVNTDRIIQQDHREDFVIATGVQHSARQFVDTAARELGIEITWQGRGVKKTGTDQHGNIVVKLDPRYFRPTKVETRLGDPTKARERLGWTPKTSFDELVAEMVREDLKSAERDELVKKHGFVAFNYHE